MYTRSKFACGVRIVAGVYLIYMAYKLIYGAVTGTAEGMHPAVGIIIGVVFGVLGVLFAIFGALSLVRISKEKPETTQQQEEAAAAETEEAYEDGEDGRVYSQAVMRATGLNETDETADTASEGFASQAEDLDEEDPVEDLDEADPEDDLDEADPAETLDEADSAEVFSEDAEDSEAETGSAWDAVKAFKH